MTTMRPPLCGSCQHLLVISAGGVYVCEAFPEGIPAAILRNEFDHRQPYEGDGGRQYLPLREGDPKFDPFKEPDGEEAA